MYLGRIAVKRTTRRGARSKTFFTRYADQILPFDITIAGVEILNESFGTSIDDTVIEQQATFVAQNIAPLQALGTAQLIPGA